MPEYTLELNAEIDLLEIGRYTARTRSLEQAERYLLALECHFEEISRKNVLEKAAFEHRDDIRVSRCQHHFVFFARDDKLGTLIVAVFHKKMDLIARLRERMNRLLRSEE